MIAISPTKEPPESVPTVRSSLMPWLRTMVTWPDSIKYMHEATMPSLMTSSFGR